MRLKEWVKGYESELVCLGVVFFFLKIVSKKMSSGSFKNVIYKMCLPIIYLINTYKKDLALNNQQWLIYHKTKSNLKFEPFNKLQFQYFLTHF